MARATSGEVAGATTQRDFAELVGVRFQAQDQGSGRELELQLVAVEQGPPAGPGYEQFSVIFRAEDDHDPAQGMCLLQAEGVATLMLTVVPIAREGDAVVYEAAFSRIADRVRRRGA